ncbi:hypothetical protein BLNAU_9797 [Blattamonas nauphoetae]|uniref:HAT C-terminal dimerisation domain-containing protein n=1 Tax=Blattamonas nauphoetae TaxID=2049346 RepID=A0ABQ9XUU1_9EUKA|nr:hypothetical protein BLNAU_9797 [Blattamonas nauphoetae]
MSALQEYENDMYPGNHRQTFGYMTPGTQGRMMKVIADYLRYQNQELRKQSDFFGLLFDESTDSSNRSQLMITICYILGGVRQFGYLGVTELGVVKKSHSLQVMFVTAKLHEKQKSSETLTAFAHRFPAESLFRSIQIFDPAQIIKNQANPIEQERERLITDWQSLKVHFRLVHHQDTSVDAELHSDASFVPTALNPPRYPLLSKLARNLLTIPVSTAPVESLATVLSKNVYGIGIGGVLF